MQQPLLEKLERIADQLETNPRSSIFHKTHMQMGKLKVFKHLNDWFEEFCLYHRRDGKVVKEGDDPMPATRYGIMMLRFCVNQGRIRQVPAAD